MEKVNIGVVGCGNISDIYFKNCSKYDFLELRACGDLVAEKAEKSAEKYDIEYIMSAEEMYADDKLDIILNLTTPGGHAEICLQALEAGKHVYVEKPLAVEKSAGQKIIDKAAHKGLLVGTAPDTFLGGGLQTCRKLIDEGWIGEPVAATAFMMCRGHESWHPDPEFYYQKGGGPMFDMGPYYLTALISLLGGVQEVTGMTGTAFSERTITSEPKYGKKIEVEVPTHVNGLLKFSGGVTGNIITSFDVWQADLPRIEIYGTDGSLSVPDPNTFGGAVKIFKPGAEGWQKVPLTHGFTENSRGLGLADLAVAIQQGRSARASGEMAYHVLEIMHGFHEASAQGSHYEVQSSVERPEPLPAGISGLNFSADIFK